MGFLEDLAANNKLHWSDIIVVVGYFLAVIGVGVWSSCRNRGSTSGYFLAGRSMHFIPVGASLFASNIGSGHFIGLAGSGASSGIGIAVFELNAIFTLLLLGWVFVPVYIAAGVFTMPEYLRKRFGGQRIRVYLAMLALLLYIFTKISADLYSGAVFIKQSLGWNIWISAVALLLLSCFFTVAGGLTAVIWTDFIQTIVMVAGAFVLMGISYSMAGGYDSIVEGFTGSRGQSNLTRMCLQGALNSSVCEHAVACGTVPANAMHFFRSVSDPDLPATGVLIGLTISGVWYWCSDQVIVQRALAAKNLDHAKAGAVLAGFMKFLPMWIMVLPGMIARVLFPDVLGCSDPDECESICGSRAGCTNMAYPLLVVQVMPNGARGLMLAVMMSALISSLTSIFNSSSTIFTMDVWKRIRRNATDVELMIVGRLFVVALVGVSIAWIPIVQSFSELFHYIQQITSYLSPPVCAVYVLAMFVKRVNEQGAFWGLVVGLVTGLARFGWEFAYTVPACGEPDPRPEIISRVHYLHFGIILFVIVCAVTMVISLLTPPIDEKHLIRLTYFGRHEEGERLDISIAEAEEKREQERSHSLTVGDRPEALELRTNGGCSISTLPALSESALMSTQQLTGSGVGAPNITYEAGVYQALPWYRKAVNWICGIEDMKDPEGAHTAAAAAADEKHLSIEEDPRWRRWNNASAVLLASCAIFVWGLFA